MRLDDGGEPLIARVDRALSEAVGEILLATSRPEPYAVLGRRHVPDAAPDLGPLAGLTAGLEALAGRGVVCVAACDLPFVPGSAFRALAEVLEADPALDAAVPRSPRGDEPLLAAYRPRVARTLRLRLDAGRLAVHDALTDLNVRSVPWASLAPDWTLLNVNDPEQLREARRRAAARPVEVGR